MTTPARPLPRSSRTPRRLVPAATSGAAAAALLTAALCGGAGAAAAASPTPTAKLTLASTAPVTLAALAPAKKAKRVVTLRASAPTRSGNATVSLAGSLRARSGRRSATFAGLRLQFGLVSASVTATSGGKRLTLFTVKARKGKPLRIDARTGAVRVEQASVTLAPAATRKLKTALRLRRAPSAKRSVGTLTLVLAGRGGGADSTTTAPVGDTAPAPTNAPVPAPAPAPPLGATPIPPPPAEAGPPCWSATPAGSTDWIACDEDGGADFGYGNLRSWINYILSPVWGTPPPGSISTTAGAAPVDPSDRYDYRLPVASTTTEGDGTVTITHTGRVTYLLPPHGIDDYVEDLVFHVAADRKSATVTLTAYYTPRPTTDDPDPDPVTATVEAMSVDLAHAASTVSAGGETTYVHAPASLTAGGQEIWGTSYEIGAPWGAFTITVPD